MRGAAADKDVAATARAIMAEPRPWPAPDAPSLLTHPMTDAGNAERLYALFPNSFRYSHEQKTFLIWDGRRWTPDDRGKMRHLSLQMARKLYEQAWECKDIRLQDEHIKHARRSEATSAITNMLKEVGSIPGVAVFASDLDRHPFLLNVVNGTVDLRDGRLRPHCRDDLITKLAPVHYDPAAECPRWNRFLQEVFAPHPDVVEFLQRAVGYSLAGDTSEECLFLCYGTGRNGKGVFLKTVCEILGDYASTADFSAFLVRKNEGPRDDIASMRGSRLVRAEESGEGARLSESIIKNLTGGDRIRARRLYENSYEFDPTWKIWLATNHKPEIRGTDLAIWSRLKIIPFEVSFAGREDRSLKQVLRDEWPGILTWAVEGCLRWQEDGLAFPEAVLAATEGYRQECDQVQRFLDDACATLPNLSATAHHLYLRYKDWSEGAGESVLTETAFGIRLTEKGYSRIKVHGIRTYQGIGHLPKTGDVGEGSKESGEGL